MCDYDVTQSIGRRYRRQDEIGTPYCVTVDFESIDDRAVTVRDRDTTAQVRVAIGCAGRAPGRATGPVSERSRSFGRVAELYNRYPARAAAGPGRPDLGDLTGVRVLEVGAGTGLVYAVPARAGRDLTVVEPDPQMRSVLERESRACRSSTRWPSRCRWATPRST